MSNVEFALIHTAYLCCFLFEYAFVSSSLVSAIVIMPGLCTYVWGGDIKIGARSCWGMGVFVLVLSNINIVWQKSLKLVKPSVSAFSGVSELGCELRVYSHLSCLVRLNRTQIGFPSWCGSFGQV